MLKVIEIGDQRYYQDENKHLLPSASSVIDVLFPMNKDFIPESALAMGTLCHKEVSKALVTELVHKSIYGVHEDPKVASRVSKALEWLAKSGMEILAVESPTKHLGVGMTPDLLAKDKNDIVVVDWKFAESIAERYLYQMELYMKAEGATRAIIVRVDRKSEVFPLLVNPDLERWEKIKSAINVRHHLNRTVKHYI